MKIIKGNKQLYIDVAQIANLLQSYKDVEIDLGTGDGRYVYKKAKKNPLCLYIGIDPSEKQLQVYSKKALKGKLENAVFVLASIESTPDELADSAVVININLPWGTLLKTIMRPELENLKKVAALIKKGGVLKIVLGYTQEFEPTEVERLELRNINKDQITKVLAPEYLKANLKITICKELEKEELKNIESTWSKKLSFGKDRPIYYFEATKI